MDKDSGEVNPQRWQPINEQKRSQLMVPYSQISVDGGTFLWKGENWRKFHGGYRRQKGRAPSELTPHLPDDTLVWRTS